MVAAVRVHKLGGPEVLTYEEIDIPAPGPGQVRLKPPDFIRPRSASRSSRAMRARAR
jgi:hypothetical protein